MGRSAHLARMRRALRIAARDRGKASLRLDTGAFLVILCGQRLTAQPLPLDSLTPAIGVVCRNSSSGEG
jgi:hypothetical protein